MLQSMDGIEVVGEAADTFEARELLPTLHPDLLLLDINLPEESGLDFLATLDPAPRVIMVTAHDEHALRAFEFGAIDYLLKPVQPQRLRLAIDRVMASVPPLKADPADPTPPPAAEDVEGATRLDLEQRILLRDGERNFFIPVSAILMVEACGTYARVVLSDASPLIQRSLTFLEHRLPERWFFRANRNAIINLRAIRHVEPWFSGGLKVTLENGAGVEISRRQARQFRDQLML